jgi:hypothetical protein
VNIKRAYKHNRGSNDAVIKAFYIKYCKILNKVKQKAKRQHYNRLIAKSEKDADTFNSFFLSFFLSIAENLNLHQVGKEDPIYFLKDAFRCKFHGIKIVPTSEAEVKNIILSLKYKNSSGYDEITRKILKACATLTS